MIDGTVAWLADSDPYVLAWLVGAALAWGALYHLAHGTTVRRRLPPGTVSATVEKSIADSEWWLEELEKREVDR